MKKLFPLFAFILFVSYNVSSQVDFEESQKFEFQNNYELSTGKNFDTKSILKLTTNSNLFLNNNLELSFEHKLNESISITAGIIGDRYNVPIFEEGEPIIIGGDTIGFGLDDFIGFKRTIRFEAYLEGRYYINQSQHVANDFGNNINGIYVSAGVGSLFYDGVENNDLQFSTYLGVGVQSRILKHGIIDFNLLLKYNEDRVFLAPSVRAGFAISKNYKNLEFDNARCNILKCFEERNYQFKIPLSNALILLYRPDWNHGYVSLSPRAKFEHRLFKGFSLNHTVSYSDLWNVNTRNSLRIRRGGSSFGYYNNLRWYYLKRRNIANGKSADNLSGLYAESLLGLTQRRFLRTDFDNDESLILYAKTRELTYGFNMGYQTRLFKRLYVDLQGYVRQTERSHTFFDESIGSTPEDGKWRRYGISLEFGLLF